MATCAFVAALVVVVATGLVLEQFAFLRPYRSVLVAPLSALAPGRDGHRLRQPLGSRATSWSSTCGWRTQDASSPISSGSSSPATPSCETSRPVSRRRSRVSRGAWDDARTSSPTTAEAAIASDAGPRQDRQVDPRESVAEDARGDGRGESREASRGSDARTPDVRQPVRSPDRWHRLRETDWDTLRTVGTFRVVDESDLLVRAQSHDAASQDLAYLPQGRLVAGGADPVGGGCRPGVRRWCPRGRVGRRAEHHPERTRPWSRADGSIPRSGQYSMADGSRAPSGKEVAWAYTHLRNGQIPATWPKQWQHRRGARARLRCADRRRRAHHGRTWRPPTRTWSAASAPARPAPSAARLSSDPGLGRPETHLKGLYLCSASAPGGVARAAQARSPPAALRKFRCRPERISGR